MLITWMFHLPQQEIFACMFAYRETEQSGFPVSWDEYTDQVYEVGKYYKIKLNEWISL